MKQVILNIPEGKYEFFMELFKSLGLNEESFPSMTNEQILAQALETEKEIKKGKTTSHQQVLNDFKKW